MESICVGVVVVIIVGRRQCARCVLTKCRHDTGSPSGDGDTRIVREFDRRTIHTGQQTPSMDGLTLGEDVGVNFARGLCRWQPSRGGALIRGGVFNHEGANLGRRGGQEHLETTAEVRLVSVGGVEGEGGGVAVEGDGVHVEVGRVEVDGAAGRVEELDGVLGLGEKAAAGEVDACCPGEVRGDGLVGVGLGRRVLGGGGGCRCWRHGGGVDG